jgi:Arc/MetJ-type ribon-helix-helix transcriptional regulator
MPSDKVTIKIPRPLYEKLKGAIKGGGFSSVNEFIVYVLRDLTADMTPPADSAKRDETGLTKEEIEIIKTRLRNLGYL